MARAILQSSSAWRYRRSQGVCMSRMAITVESINFPLRAALTLLGRVGHRSGPVHPATPNVVIDKDDNIYIADPGEYHRIPGL